MDRARVLRGRMPRAGEAGRDRAHRPRGEAPPRRAGRGDQGPDLERRRLGGAVRRRRIPGFPRPPPAPARRRRRPHPRRPHRRRRADVALRPRRHRLRRRAPGDRRVAARALRPDARRRSGLRGPRRLPAPPRPPLHGVLRDRAVRRHGPARGGRLRHRTRRVRDRGGPGRRLRRRPGRPTSSAPRRGQSPSARGPRDDPHPGGDNRGGPHRGGDGNRHRTRPPGGDRALATPPDRARGAGRGVPRRPRRPADPPRLCARDTPAGDRLRPADRSRHRRPNSTPGDDRSPRLGVRAGGSAPGVPARGRCRDPPRHRAARPGRPRTGPQRARRRRARGHRDRRHVRRRRAASPSSAPTRRAGAALGTRSRTRSIPGPHAGPSSAPSPRIPASTPSRSSPATRSESTVTTCRRPR